MRQARTPLHAHSHGQVLSFNVARADEIRVGVAYHLLHLDAGDSVRRPQYFGTLTNDIVYRRLAPGRPR